MASTNFINECKNRANANRLGKIIIDGITSPITNSDNLQSFEIDSGCYTDGNIIGSVYAKCLKANFIAEQNNLTDKPMQAQIGVKYTDLSNEYINMGKYKVERPNNEITANMSQITAYSDLYTNLDSKYICNIDYSTGDKTLSDLYIDVCNQLGLTPVTTTFINSTIPITANPFTNGEKNRTVLQTIAKISCSFIDIDNDTNKIDLCWLSSSKTPDYTFYKNDYSSVEGGQVVCGPINCLIIKNSQVDDENVTIKDDESIKKNGENSIIISEDYILYNSDLRQQAITDIWNRVKGMKYVDCKLTTYYGKPFLKLGDYIRIYTSETEYFDTYVLKHNFTYDGSFTSIIESPVLTEQEIKTKQNISLGETLRNTQIIVDKQLGKITSTVDEMNTKVEDITTTTQTSTGGNSLYLKEALESNALEYSIDGKCEQSTRSGKNLYNYKDTTNVGNGVTADKDGWITIAYDNTSDTSETYQHYYTNNLNLKTDTNYNIIMEVKNVSSNEICKVYPVSVYSTTQGQFINQTFYNFSDLSNNTIKQFIKTTKNSFDGITTGLRTFASFGAGAKGSITFRLSVLEDTTVTAETFKYEAFGASPSPDYPSEIETVKGIRNLFDGVLFNGYLNNGLVADSKWKTTDYIEVKSNTKYITSYLKNTTRVLYEEYTSKDVSSRVSARKETTPKTAITTQNTTKYIRFSFNDNSLTDKEIMLEPGSVAHSYVPYGTYEKIKVTGKNWFDKDNTYTAISEVSGYVSSDYIPVKKGDTINKTNSVMFWFYDKSKNQIGFASGSTTTTVSLDNVAYVRCNVLKTDLDTFMLTINQELTDYEPYKEKEVLIDLAKENLFDGELESGLIGGAGENVSSTTGIRSKNYIQINPSTSYIVSSSIDCTISLRFYDSSDKFLSSGITTNSPNKFTAPSNASKLRIALNNNTDLTTKVKIYKGTNADDSYELNSIGDTKDRLEIINGVVDIQKRIGKVVLDGINYKAISKSGNINNMFNITNIENIKKPNSNDDKISIISTHFKNDYSANELYNNKNLIGIAGKTDNQIAIAFGINSKITTNEQANIWLQANPVTVYYELAIPETITLPNTNIPLYEGINHVTLVEDLETTTSIKYLRKTPISGEYALNQDLNKTNSNLADTNNQLSQTQSDIDNTKTNLNNNYYNKEQVDSINSTTTQNITQIRNTMEQNITSTNASISKIQEEITNGVSKVTTTTGTFDENGLNISKSGQQMSSTLDWDGLEVVRDKGKATETEVLTVRSAGVEAENMTVRNFFIKKPIRIEKCKSITDSTKVGLGFFWIGE